MAGNLPNIGAQAVLLGLAAFLDGVNRMEASVTQYHRQVQASTPSTSALGSAVSSVGSFMRTAAATTVGFVAAQAGIAGITDLWDGLKAATIDFNASLQQTTLGFDVLLRNSDAARGFLLAVQQQAIQLPGSFVQMANSARLLFQAGVPLNDVLATMKVVMGTAALSGQDFDLAMKRISVDLIEMGNQGKVTQRNLNSLAIQGVQIGEVLAVMAKNMHTTVGALEELKAKGQLPAKEFLQAFREWGESRFGDLLERQARTFTGGLEVIRDALLTIGGTAFRPIFDRIGDVVAAIAKLTGDPALLTWAGQVAAAIDAVLDSFGALAGGIATALGNVLSVVLSIGQAIYVALQWLNPFATHSPSLVDQVDEGTMRIIADFQKLSAVELPLKLAGDAAKEFGESVSDLGRRTLQDLQTATDSTRDKIQDLSNKLREAKDRVNDLKRAQLPGEQAVSDKVFALDQRIKQAELRRVEMQLGGAGKKALEQQDKVIEKLRLQREQLQLQADIKFDPLHRQIEQLADPKLVLPFKAIVDGIKEAQRQEAILNPQLAEEKKHLDSLEAAAKLVRQEMANIADSVRDIAATEAKAKAARGGGGAGKVPFEPPPLRMPTPEELDPFAQLWKSYQASYEKSKAQFKATTDAFFDTLSQQFRLGWNFFTDPRAVASIITGPGDVARMVGDRMLQLATDPSVRAQVSEFGRNLGHYIVDGTIAVVKLLSEWKKAADHAFKQMSIAFAEIAASVGLLGMDLGFGIANGIGEGLSRRIGQIDWLRIIRNGILLATPGFKWAIDQLFPEGDRGRGGGVGAETPTPTAAPTQGTGGEIPGGRGMRGLAYGGILTRPSLLVDLATLIPYATVAERGPEEVRPVSSAQVGMNAPRGSQSVVFSMGDLRFHANDLGAMREMVIRQVGLMFDEAATQATGRRSLTGGGLALA